MMIIALYTSRVILSTLGFEDYGIYNVVGGVVVMLSFISVSLSTATQRFLNFEMGLENKNSVREIFSTALTFHVIIALIVVIIAETAGLWFVKNQLDIPAERMVAAIWVYHFSVTLMFVIIVATPFNALIIAHEKMNVYAWVSVIDASLKLIIVFILQTLYYDKLIMYGLLLLAVTVLTNGTYIFYCRKKFHEIEFIFRWNKEHAKKLMNFSGWMIAGTSADILSGQGVNILINIFFGPVYNAARGIASQVQAGFYALISNIVVVAKPQIVKSYSQKDFSYMYKLIFSTAKFSFFLLYIISLPVLLETDYILHLWLKEVPEFTVIFIQLIIIDLLIQASCISIASASQASGKIKNYQIIVSISFLSVFCFTIFLFKSEYPVYSTFIITIFISIISFFARLIELKRNISFPIKKFLFQVIFRLFITAIISTILPFIFLKLIEPSFYRFCGIVFISFISVIATTWFIGFVKFEKDFIKQKIKSFIK